MFGYCFGGLPILSGHFGLRVFLLRNLSAFWRCRQRNCPSCAGPGLSFFKLHAKRWKSWTIKNCRPLLPYQISQAYMPRIMAPIRISRNCVFHADYLSSGEKLVNFPHTRKLSAAPGRPRSKKQKPKRSAEEPVKAEPSSEMAEFTRRNYLYEALGDAFRLDDYRDKAKLVAAQFFLRRQGKQVEPATIKVTELFLEKVAGMERIRLEAIREIADHIADHLIIGAGERRAADQLVRRKLRLGEFLQFLSYVQRKLSAANKPLPWEKVLNALNLESDDDRTASDYWLVQELVLIRLYERLANSSALAELPEPDVPEPVLPAGSQSENIN